MLLDVRMLDGRQKVKWLLQGTLSIVEEILVGIRSDCRGGAARIEGSLRTRMHSARGVLASMVLDLVHQLLTFANGACVLGCDDLWWTRANVANNRLVVAGRARHTAWLAV